MNNMYLYAAIFMTTSTMIAVGLFLYDLHSKRNDKPHPKMLQEGINAIFNDAFKDLPDHLDLKLKEPHYQKRVSVKVTQYPKES
jgi:hypothetical protein